MQDPDFSQRVVLDLLLRHRRQVLSTEAIRDAVPGLSDTDVDYAVTRLCNDGLANRLEGRASASWAAVRMDQLTSARG